MTADADSGQVSRRAAEVYEEFFVPALFGEWADRVVAEAALEPGQRVLDVGCGTGVVARRAFDAVRPGGAVVGVDPNEGMLRVARDTAPALDWRPGRAEALPFDSGSFDAVLSQFALMFFEAPADGIREMARVARPGGRITVAVWDRIEASPGYSALADLLGRLFGDWAAGALRAPFAMGEPGRLRDLFARGGLPRAEVRTRVGRARFPSLRSWMHTDVRGWTLSEDIDDAQFERLVDEAEAELGPFVADDGSVSFEVSAHIVVAEAPAGA